MKPVSLSRYLILTTCGLGLCMAVFLTIQGSRFFLLGFDFFSYGMMSNVAESVELNAQGRGQLLDRHVVSQWSDLPHAIASRFENTPSEYNKIQKEFEDWIIFAPPKRAYILYIHQVDDLPLRYVYDIKLGPKNPKKINFGGRDALFDPMVEIALWGIFSLIIFTISIFMIMRKITQPLDELYHWSKTLDIESPPLAVPEFRYIEITKVAQITQHSFVRAHKSMLREKEFLEYASHELRTPITVIRSNIQLLKKAKLATSKRELDIQDRIDRASLTMKSITETLLWLNHDASHEVPLNTVDLAALIEQIVFDHKYLISHKNLDLKLDLQAYELTIASDAARILLTNLIRNAFQHTALGEIVIKQQGATVCIYNSVGEMESNSGLGFGLGLKLSRKIVKAFAWQMQEKTTAQYNQVDVDLAVAKTNKN